MELRKAIRFAIKNEDLENINNTINMLQEMRKTFAENSLTYRENQCNDMIVLLCEIKNGNYFEN